MQSWTVQTMTLPCSEEQRGQMTGSWTIDRYISQLTKGWMMMKLYLSKLEVGQTVP